MDPDKARKNREGRFLAHRERKSRSSRLLMAAVLLSWDGLLLYMVAEELIVPVYGAAFVIVISIYLGYQL